jgi:flotillin
MMNLTIFVPIIAIAVVVVLTTIWILSRYRRCPSDKILVVFGKAGNKKVTDENGKEKTKVLPSKIIHGGGTFVWPVIQDYRMMDLAPHKIQPKVLGLSSQNIKVSIPVTLTTGIGTTDILMQNAAARFLSASKAEMDSQIEDILIGETRAIMATMPIEEINADRNKFLENARQRIELELNKVGFTIININIADIDDNANYIVNLGKKAATQAQAQAEADIAEQEKEGKIKIANTKKEEAIQVAEANREELSTVAKTVQEREVAVAQAKKEQAIKLAEAEKERAEGVAKATAEQTIAVATATQLADSAQAEQESIATVNVAQAQAKAAAEAAEAEQTKEARIAEATQKKEANIAKYESDRRQVAAEANKKAGVAEQMATIDVAKAEAEAGKAKADAERVTGTAKVEARMAVAKAEQEQQIKVNEMAAKAKEAELQATMIVPANKEKEEATIKAQQTKAVATLEAEAAAARIIKEAEANAEAIRMKKLAEAEGEKSVLLAQAEGKRASLMAEAEQAQAVALAPALAFEKMVQTAGGNPDIVVQYMMTDKWQGIVGEQVKALEHIQLGNVNVYGDTNTGAQFMQSIVKNFAPAIDAINTGLKGKIQDLFTSDKPSLPSTDNKEDAEFEPVK